MTPQEAIEKIRVTIKEIEWEYPVSYVAFDMAIKALEKQIPKKPRPYKNFKCARMCPACNVIVTILENDIVCDCCGQTLNWSEDVNEALV